VNLFRKLFVVVALAALAGAAMTASANARDQIHIVGSSTVFPFAIAVAEEFGYVTGFKTPVVESTGSGGGLKLFCAGIGVGHPDITNASRRIKESEIDACARNGITEITEVKIGFDGIVIANSKRTPRYELTLKQVFTALAKEVPIDGKMVLNPYVKWSEIDPSLPDTKIEVFGPPPTSGTRDALVELAMEGGCKKYETLAALEKQDKNAFKATCHTIREDGAFVEAGENDNLIVQKLEANPNALGVFGFGFLDQNLDRLQGSRIDGVDPEFDSIAEGSYPVSRSMYFYVKGAHVGVIPGIEDYIDVFTQEATWGDEGLLTDLGLIPLPASERVLVRDQAMALESLRLE
jgi:phosphate transport system substrate-binding protein